jgi:cobalt/nickel transport system ATP-binding protein
MKNEVLVNVENLSYTYSDGNRALENVSFKIRNGETVGIVGPNGAGKSTLLLILLGILQPRNGNGHVTIAGKPLTKNTLTAIRKHVGLVFQDPDDQLFMSTVFDDVAFGPINMGLNETQVHKRVRLALHKVGLSGYEDRCPHHLSFGEKKRVALATVLSMHPEILLLDEPTANLDPQARRNTIKLINGFHSVKLISSHDIEMLVETCDKVLLLDNGKLIKNGNPKEIFTNEKLLINHGLEMPAAIRILGKKGFGMVRNSAKLKKQK